MISEDHPGESGIVVLLGRHSLVICPAFFGLFGLPGGTARRMLTGLVPENTALWYLGGLWFFSPISSAPGEGRRDQSGSRGSYDSSFFGHSLGFAFGFMGEVGRLSECYLVWFIVLPAFARR